jgi:ribosomal protein S27E
METMDHYSQYNFDKRTYEGDPVKFLLIKCTECENTDTYFLEDTPVPHYCGYCGKKFKYGNELDDRIPII